jgi:hypothetical protein
MKKHLLIPLALFITSSLFGQEVIHLDLDVNCQEVNYDSKLEYPLDRGNVDLQVEWLFSSDTVLLNGQISFDDNELVGNLLFFEGLPSKAFDVKDRKFLNIGQGKFKDIFQPLVLKREDNLMRTR